MDRPASSYRALRFAVRASVFTIAVASTLASGPARAQDGDAEREMARLRERIQALERALADRTSAVESAQQEARAQSDRAEVALREAAELRETNATSQRSLRQAVEAAREKDEQIARAKADCRALREAVSAWEALVRSATDVVVDLEAPVPALDALVMSVAGGDGSLDDLPADAPILVSVGRDDGVQPGLTFTIERDGAFVAKVVAVRVLPDCTACRVLLAAPGRSIETGDGVVARPPSPAVPPMDEPPRRRRRRP